MGFKKKQQYHLEPPNGLMNDPNGLSWFQNRYYVFFQWNRYKKDHSHKEWGMFTSKDLVNWSFEGGAIEPGEHYDCSGIHSGSALEIGGQLCAFYTGSRKDSEGRRHSSQCLAVSSDGRNFEKKGVILTTPKGYTEHFRDPKIFRTKENGYYMVLGGQQENGKGSVVLCQSKDGFHWSYAHMLASAREHEMVECPDLFLLDGQYFLLYCLQRRDNERDQVLEAFSVYRPVSFDEKKGILKEKELEEAYLALDDGFDFFAPQTFETSDGRRLMIAWMSRMGDEQERIFGENEPSIHCLTLPRELRCHKGRLYQKPIQELYTLLGDDYKVKRNQKGSYVIRPGQRAWHLKLRLQDCQEGLYLNFGEIDFRWDGKKATVMRHNWADGSREIRNRCLDGLTELEVWSDQSSMEIFLNGGEAAFSARIFPMEEAPVIVIAGMSGKEELRVRQVKYSAAIQQRVKFAM